jgi:hypothetical protein
MLQTKDTRIHNDENDLPVHRVELPEHFATEDDATHLYVPKSQAETVKHLVDRFRDGEDSPTSMQPRTMLPYVGDNAVRNHATVMVTTSAALVDRQRSAAQLARMAAGGSDDAATILRALKDFVIE